MAKKLPPVPLDDQPRVYGESVTVRQVKKTLLCERPWCADFLNAMAQTANVTAACEYSGVGRQTAYDWRNKNPEFAEAWDDAHEECIDRVEMALLDRVLGRKPSNAAQNIAIFFWLKNFRPERHREWYDASKMAQILASHMTSSPQQKPIDVTPTVPALALADPRDRRPR